MHVTVGTRRSALATTQTRQFIDALRRQRPEVDVQTREIVTKGDRVQHIPLAEIGGKGLFITEIEDALLRGEIDFAVHSMKDVPAELAAGLTVGCVPQRADARDVLVSACGYTLATLPEGARVGTSALRRKGQLLAIRPDLRVETLRGNIDTRLRKLEGLDATLLAAAGLQRMGWWDGERVRFDGRDLTAHPLDPKTFLPAPGQGALAVECRVADSSVRNLLQTAHDIRTAAQVEAERAFMVAVGGSCQVPVAVYAEPEQGENVTLYGWIGSPDGAAEVRAKLSGRVARALGEQLGRRLLDQGGADILASL